MKNTSVLLNAKWNPFYSCPGPWAVARVLKCSCCFFLSTSRKGQWAVLGTRDSQRAPYNSAFNFAPTSQDEEDCSRRHYWKHQLRIRCITHDTNVPCNLWVLCPAWSFKTQTALLELRSAAHVCTRFIRHDFMTDSGSLGIPYDAYSFITHQ